jgi:hypothetical protein
MIILGIVHGLNENVPLSSTFFVEERVRERRI